MDFRALIVAAMALTLAGCRPAPSPQRSSEDSAAAYVPFAERKADHQTRLRFDAPSTGRFEQGFVPSGATAVRYPSGEHGMLAWLWLPDAAKDGPVPGLVYLHGAFALAPKDAAAVQPFVDAGLAVLTPALRGENGNPGRLELLYGEVDDAVAAVQWLAARPEVDSEHVYAIGHSIGGGVAAMLALHPEAPLRLTGSVGGIYVPQTFVRWSRSKGNADLVRFDPNDPDEGSLRTLGPNVRDLVHPHHAYIGEDDAWFHPNAQALSEQAQRWDRPVWVHRIPGDHMSSLRPALAAFLERIEADLGS